MGPFPAGTNGGMNLPGVAAGASGAVRFTDPADAGDYIEVQPANRGFAIGALKSGSFLVGSAVAWRASASGLAIGTLASAPADGVLPGGNGLGGVIMWIDEAGHTLNFKARYSDGTTIRSVDAPLALT